MKTPSTQKRPCVMIVDSDLEYGIKLADWLAAHGYQAVLIRSMERIIEECRDLSPQAVCIGLSPSEPIIRLDLERLFRRIKTTAPHVPVITMGGPTSRDQTDFRNDGSIRHLHLPIKPVELTYIGRLLQSELSAAAALNSPSTEPAGTSQTTISARIGTALSILATSPPLEARVRKAPAPTVPSIKAAMSWNGSTK